MRLTSNAAVPDRTAVSAEEHEQYESLGYVGSTRFGVYGDGTSTADGCVVHPRDRTRLVNTWRDAMARQRSSHDWSAASSSSRRRSSSNQCNADLWGGSGLVEVSAGRHDDALAALKKLDALESDPQR